MSVSPISTAPNEEPQDVGELYQTHRDLGNPDIATQEYLERLAVKMYGNESPSVIEKIRDGVLTVNSFENGIREQLTTQIDIHASELFQIFLGTSIGDYDNIAIPFVRFMEEYEAAVENENSTDEELEDFRVDKIKYEDMISNILRIPVNYRYASISSETARIFAGQFKDYIDSLPSALEATTSARTPGRATSPVRPGASLPSPHVLGDLPAVQFGDLPAAPFGDLPDAPAPSLASPVTQVLTPVEMQVPVQGTNLSNIQDPPDQMAQIAETMQGLQRYTGPNLSPGDQPEVRDVLIRGGFSDNNMIAAAQQGGTGLGNVISELGYQQNLNRRPQGSPDRTVFDNIHVSGPRNNTVSLVSGKRPTVDRNLVGDQSKVAKANDLEWLRGFVINKPTDLKDIIKGINELYDAYEKFLVLLIEKNAGPSGTVFVPYKLKSDPDGTQPRMYQMDRKTLAAWKKTIREMSDNHSYFSWYVRGRKLGVPGQGLPQKATPDSLLGRYSLRLVKAPWNMWCANEIFLADRSTDDFWQDVAAVAEQGGDDRGAINEYMEPVNDYQELVFQVYSELVQLGLIQNMGEQQPRTFTEMGLFLQNTAPPLFLLARRNSSPPQDKLNLVKSGLVLGPKLVDGVPVPRTSGMVIASVAMRQTFGDGNNYPSPYVYENDGGKRVKIPADNNSLASTFDVLETGLEPSVNPGVSKGKTPAKFDRERFQWISSTSIAALLTIHKDDPLKDQISRILGGGDGAPMSHAVHNALINENVYINYVKDQVTGAAKIVQDAKVKGKTDDKLYRIVNSLPLF